jgi:HNH endonuclease/AP2 domain
MLTHERLLQLLSYDPETGVWTWNNPDAMNKKPINKVAGTISVHGYRIITISGSKYRSARLAQFYMTGSWPEEEMDHINRDSLDDRWENLRVACRSENALNRGIQSNNTSGVPGVHWDESRKKWYVQVKKHGNGFFYGRFDTLEEAIAARDIGAKQFHGTFANLNTPSELAS